MSNFRPFLIKGLLVNLVLWLLPDYSISLT